MRTATTFRPPRAALYTGVAAAMVLLSLGSCSLKDSEFFALTSGLPGDIVTSVTGTPVGATVRITGNGVDRSDIVGPTPVTFGGFANGIYTATVTPPTGYDCTDPVRTITLTDANPSATVTFPCSIATLGSFRFTVTGLGSGLELAATLTGPTPRTGQIGTNGLTWTGLTQGAYTWEFDQIANNDCQPDNGGFTVIDNTEHTQAVTCASTTGTITVTVTGGATASVAYAGPVSSSVVVGTTPVAIPGLPNGIYNFTIPTNPTGFTCTTPNGQVNLPAGGSGAVTFGCTPVQPTTVTVDLSTIPNTGGAVASGTYSVALRDDANVQHGSTTIYTIGASTYWGSNPLRLGAGFSSGYGINYGGLLIDGQNWTTAGVGLCVLNAILDVGHPLVITHKNAGGTVLGQQNVTMSPSCVWSIPPVGSTRTEITAPNDRFIDFYLWKFWR